MDMLCLTWYAFEAFLLLIGPDAILPTEGGLMLGIQEPAFWFWSNETELWCSPDVPRLSR